MLVRGGGAIAAGIGCAAILGLLLNLPHLASLGKGLIPMAPSTAVLFIVFGSVLLSAQRSSRSRIKLWLIPIIFAVSGMIAAALFFFSIRGIYLDIESLGIESKETLGGTPLGHMSPVTAVSFLLYSLMCPVVLAAPSDSIWRAKAAWWTAVVLIATNVTLLLAYVLGTPMFYGGSYIPPAATTSLAFLALGIALAALSRPLAWPETFCYNQDGSYSFRTLVVFFVFLAAGIISAGYYYQHHHEKQYLTEAESQLSVIANLKISELLLWREERLWDAGLFYNNSAFATLVKAFIRYPDRTLVRRDVEAWLGHVKAIRGYNRLFLLDARGGVKLTFPENASEPLAFNARHRAGEALSTGRVSIADFYRNEFSGKIYVSIMVPVFDPEDKGSPLGVMVMQINPEEFLYPFLQRWPNTSTSAETLLVRREGNDVLFLNGLRFRKDAALKLRIPLERQDVPSVMAVTGKEGVVRGIDYRGKPVLAVLRAVPDSPWHLIARMDLEEIYAPLRERQWMTLILVSALLLTAAAGVSVVWRQQRISYYNHSLAQNRRNEERLQCLLNVFQHNAQNVQALLHFALAEALSMTASKFGYIYDYDEEKKRFTLNSWSPDGLQACGAFNPEDINELDKAGIWGDAVRQRRPIMVNDFAAPDPPGKVYPVGHVPLRRLLIIPHVDRGKIVAVVGVANKESVYEDADILQLTLLMGSVWKIVERKEADLTLKESELKLRRAEEMAHLGHWRYDLRRGSITWSDEMYRIFGLRREAVKNSFTVADMIGYCHPDDLAHCVCSFAPSVLENDNFVEYRITRPSGEMRYVVSNGEIEQNEAGEVVALFGTLLDTTELKKKERELEQKNAEMERFTYTVSHDLKSPLVTVKSFIGFLEKDMAAADSGRIAKDILYIKTSTDRMSQLLEQILVMSRIGKVVTPPVQVSFSELVQEVLELVAGSITEGGVTVQLVCDESVTLYGDRPRLIEIWQNLIENSFKYMGAQSTPLIEIGFEMTNGTPVFFVADNGLGIDRCYHAKIFNLFDKLDPQSEGTGLGLALVKRIVEMYDGEIWVESDGVGYGTCFRFTLPLATNKQAMNRITGHDAIHRC